MRFRKRDTQPMQLPQKMNVPENNLKLCTKCKKQHVYERFGKDKSRKDGLDDRCKDCEKEDNHAQYVKRKLNRCTPDFKCCITCKQTKPKYEFPRNNTNLEWLDPNCKDCYWTFERRIQTIVQAANRHTRVRAKKNQERGVCDLTVEKIVQKYESQRGKCYISGFDMVMRQDDLYTMSLERIDNSKGELDSNTVLVCHVFNHFFQMTREKLYYILHHNDQPMNVEKSMYCHGVFEQLVSGNLHSDRVRNLESKLSADELRKKFLDQKGLCAYSGVRMYVGTNIPTFQMSVERVDRTKPHNIDNIVLIIRELNVGAKINLNREIIEKWRSNACINESFDLGNLRAKWDLEAVPSKDHRTCKECNLLKPVCDFETTVYGSFYVRCRVCRNAEKKLKTCKDCKRRRPQTFFQYGSNHCGCMYPHHDGHQEVSKRRKTE